MPRDPAPKPGRPFVIDKASGKPVRPWSLPGIRTNYGNRWGAITAGGLLAAFVIPTAVIAPSPVQASQPNPTSREVDQDPSPSAPSLPTPEQIATGVEGNWTGKDIAKLMAVSGFPQERVAYAVAICMAEDPTGNPAMVGDTGGWVPNRKLPSGNLVYGESVGFCQLRELTQEYFDETAPQNLDPLAQYRAPGRNLNPVNAAEAMFMISKRGTDFSPWSVDTRQSGQDRPLVEDKIVEAMKQTAEAFGELGLVVPEQDFGSHQHVLSPTQDQGVSR